MKKILIIRRDNIGDLICTTPMIRLIREYYPDARIDLLVNSYNAPVLENNPDISSTFIYTKKKHRQADQSLLTVYWNKIVLLWKLWCNRYDLAVLPSGGYNPRSVGYAHLIGAKKLLGYAGVKPDKRLNLPAEPDAQAQKHEVEFCCDLLKKVGIKNQAPGLSLYVTDKERDEFKNLRQLNTEQIEKSFIGIHISARKPSNRWLENYYIELIHRLWNKEKRPVALFWSPGEEHHPQHPGDDSLALRIKRACKDIELVPMATITLRELIVGLSFCDKVFCSDGGAMHIAAGLGKPVICLFGDSDATRWRPWGVPCKVLQPKTRRASDVTPDQVMAAFNELAEFIILHVKPLRSGRE